MLPNPDHTAAPASTHSAAHAKPMRVENFTPEAFFIIQFSDPFEAMNEPDHPPSRSLRDGKL
ncbi:MAG: hypothetical protein IV112_18600 [Methyloversatilis discipulorum]|uniref:hypothetical protein n=1 Tax=Methyloversatilis TaxID=378210 RepID=UPI0026F10918|nr:hypothetical protein [Methyloversatilis discipulorum]MBT9518699.1 hypothetical protein [Methyloversatilis discipulorum]